MVPAMDTTTKPHTLTIAGCEIRRDADGRYCLNDLHKVSGNNKRHRPSLWLANKATKELIVEVNLEAGNPASNEVNLEARIPASNSVRGRGITATYVVKELVYAYAMWISPKFHLRVIRAYDALVTGTLVKPLTQAEKFWFNRRPIWGQIRPLALDGYTYRQIAAQVSRSPASIGNSVRRMVQVGLIDPAQLFRAHYLPATAERLIATKQLCLDWGVPA